MSLDSSKRDDEYVQWLTIACAPYLLIGLVNGLYLPYLFELNPPYFWFADGLHNIGLLLFAVVILAAKLDLYPRDYGFRSPFPDYTIGAFAFLVFILSFGTILAYGLSGVIAAAVFGTRESAFGYQQVLPTSGMTRMIATAYLSLTAAFSEEIICRAIPWLIFQRLLSSPKPAYVIVTSVIFALIHWETGIANVVASFSVGLVFSIAYLKLRNIWPLVIAHAVIDLIAFM